MAFLPSSALPQQLQASSCHAAANVCPSPAASSFALLAALAPGDSSVSEIAAAAPPGAIPDDLFSAPTPYQTFEPVVNVPALAAFVVVTGVFGLLQMRIGRVQEAARRRTAALDQLRRVKSWQLSSGGGDLAAAPAAAPADSSADSNAADAEASALVRAALDEYEAALREELRLRQVVPGVARIVAPTEGGDPRTAEADLAAARQFLGLDITEAGEVVPIDESDAGRASKRSTAAVAMEGQSSSSSSSSPQEGEGEGMSTGSKAVLLVVAMLQLGLLYLLSFDPMKATDVVFN
jgi:hypothetical protein